MNSGQRFLTRGLLISLLILIAPFVIWSFIKPSTSYGYESVGLIFMLMIAVPLFIIISVSSVVIGLMRGMHKKNEKKNQIKAGKFKSQSISDANLLTTFIFILIIFILMILFMLAY